MSLFASILPGDLLSWLRDGGLIGILAFALIGLWRGWWVMGREVKERDNRIKRLEDYNKRLLDVVLRGAKISERDIRRIEEEVNGHE